jgi:hypothetical protein
LLPLHSTPLHSTSHHVVSARPEPHCETHLKDPPLPIHLDDLFLPHLDLGLDLFRLGFELIVSDQPGVRAVGGEEGEVFVPLSRARRAHRSICSSARFHKTKTSPGFVLVLSSIWESKVGVRNSPPVQHAQPDPSFPLGLLPVFSRIPFFRPEWVPLGRVDRLVVL